MTKLAKRAVINMLAHTRSLTSQQDNVSSTTQRTESAYRTSLANRKKLMAECKADLSAYCPSVRA